VWNANNSEQKKSILLEAVAGFTAKGKDGQNVMRFQRSVHNAKSSQELDRIAAQLALFPDNRVL